jgi:putative tricarboxylic transport membrane protein
VSELTDLHTQAPTEARSGLRAEQIAGLLLAAAGAYAAWESLKLPLGSLDNPGPGYMPIILAALLIALGLVVALAGKKSQPLAEIRWPELRHAVAIFGTCVFAALAIEPLGYRLTVAIMLVFLVGVIEKKPALSVLLVSGGMSIGSYWLFATLLKVPLPPGLFGF